MKHSWTKRIFFLAVLSGLAACSADFQTQNVQTQNRESRCLPMYRFLIPEGYVGWIRVDFNIKDATPLPIEGDHLVFTIPESGYFRTPAKYMCGWPQDYYYYSGNSRKPIDSQTMIRWNGFASGAEPDVNKEIADYIFIGTEAEFERYRHSTYDAQGVPKYGRLNNPVQR
jgi:hypothetical protein